MFKSLSTFSAISPERSTGFHPVNQSNKRTEMSVLPLKINLLARKKEKYYGFLWKLWSIGE
jgi:hypothetical protein